MSSPRPLETPKGAMDDRSLAEKARAQAKVPSSRSPAIGSKPALSIRWIVAAAAVVLTAAPVLTVGYVSERNSRAVLARDMETRLLLSARNLANTSAGALLGDYPELTLQPLIRTMMSEQPEITFAVVLDHRGDIQGDPDARQLGRPFQAPEGLVRVERSRPLEPGETIRANQRLLVAETPVHGPDRRVIGAALVALDRHHLERALAGSRRQQALVLGILVLIAVTIAFLSMSLLLRPMGALRGGLERIGRGDLDTPVHVRDRTELGVLADSINDVARALKQAQRELIERERLAYEIDLARQIQRSLLPAAPLRTPSIVIRGEQRAAAEVGGDSYDILPLADGRVAVAVGDVSGKGLAGCLVMAMLSALVRNLRHVHDSPSDLLAALDESLGESLSPGVFVTLFYCIVDPKTGRVTWASAGHNPALVYRRSDGTVERCASRGIPLGAMRGGAIRSTLQDQVLELGPGDLLVQYTDAFTEAFAPVSRDQFGLDRVIECVARHGSRGVDALIEGLQGDVDRWIDGAAREDDETLVVIGRPVSETGVTEAAEPPDPLRWLDEARERGLRLELCADMDLLRSKIFEWMQDVPLLAGLDRADFDLLGSALYEACANIAEHGYGRDVSRRFELWWVPPSSDPRSIRREEEGLRVLRAGRFVIRDDGLEFRADERQRADFHDQQVWRRGRGLGLEIIHRVMHAVVYEPGTSQGNITSLRFGPRISSIAPGEASP